MSWINFLSTTSEKYGHLRFVTGDSPYQESFGSIQFFNWETYGIQSIVTISVYATENTC